jgi:threonine dehydratase
MKLPTFADVRDAAERLNGLAVRTPLIRCDALDQAAGGKVFIKPECLQHTGSFKFRGAYNRLCRLTADERRAGVVAFSSGNHAQGVASAAQILGLPAVIVMPSDAPAVKVAATREYGADVVFYDRFTESREEIAERLAREKGAVVVPSYDDFHIVAGQGTAGLEAAEQLEEMGVQAGVLACPVSGGGFIAGIGLAFEALSPSTRLYAVEPAGYDDHSKSLAADERVKITPPGPSLCDALLAPTPGELTFVINRRLLAGAVQASDDEALDAMAFAVRHLKIVLEPGGAVALAALLQGRLPLNGGAALIIASGGNVDPDVYVKAISR